MKNKGFTLIELLGGILILTVIALITIPIISGVVNKARLNALKDSAYGLIDASNLYYAMNGVSDNTRFDKNELEDTLKELKYKGHVESGTVIINKKGQTTICITDGKNSAYKNYTESQVTLVAKKTCNVPSNSNIVYLENDRTLEELTNLELTQRLLALEESKLDIDDIYPVGSIYTSTCGGTTETGCLKTAAEVKAKLGGTWEVYGDGRVLKSSTGDSGKTGGSNKVTLAANQIPSLSTSGTAASAGEHTHSVSGSAASAGAHTHSVSGTAASAGAHTHSVSTSGGNHSHSYSTPTQSGYYAAVGSNYGVVTGGNTSTGYSGNLSMSGTAASAGAHTHSVSGTAASAGAHTHTVSGSAATAGAHTHTVTASYTNSNQEKVNVQDPYITVYMYKRIS